MHSIRAISTLAVVLGLWSAPVAASDSAQEHETAPTAAELETAPLSLRGTRGAPHPDCSNKVPLWEHEVQAGEHLGLIAGRYGVRRSALVELNEIADPNLIRTGQTLKVCPEIAPRQTKQVTHVVASGETMSAIAKQYDLTVSELLDRAGAELSNPNLVRVGQSFSFWVDDGMVEAFRPPLPKKKAKKKRAGGRKSHGRTRVSVQLDGGATMHIKRPRLAFGTAKTVRLIERAVGQYKRRHAKSPKVLIGDMSKKGGGKIEPHLSHRRGVDIDVGYVLKGDTLTTTRFRGVNSKTLDPKRTWALVKAFLDTDEVRYIFMDYALQKQLYEFARSQGTSEDELDELFQYPRGRGRSHGIIRHWRSHKNHFHVRFEG
ncbi:MAG: penicillin-insensitive murein endopeptidase [Nannocystaceae bacterium]|nr:penicillin-insensitive murein endopeptidase [bacterium]